MVKKEKSLVLFLPLLLLLLLPFDTVTHAAAINQVMGMAVAKNRLIWNDLKDASVGDNLTSGLGAFQLYTYDPNAGTMNRLRGDTANGMHVNITKVIPFGGTSFYAIKYTSLVETSSVNFPFGFTSKIVVIETPATNTADVVVDWLGGTAVVPAADTAGDDLIPPGRIITLDNYEGTSISAISSSGTQSVYIRAFQ